MAIINSDFLFNSQPIDENTFFGWTAVLFLDLITGLIYIIEHTSTITFLFFAIGLYFEACGHHLFISELFVAARQMKIEWKL